MNRLYAPLLSLCLVACSSADNTAADARAGDDGDAGQVGPDAGQRAECDATIHYGTVSSLANQAASGEGGASGRANIESRGMLNGDATPDGIEVLLFANNGPFGEWIDNTGAYQLTGTEADYKTCGACVLIQTDIDGDGRQKGTYMARSGQLELLEVGTRFRAVITNAEFRHVTIAGDFTTTDHADGCTSFVTRAEFDVEIINDFGVRAAR